MRSRAHPHLDRVESEVASMFCPDCRSSWARRQGSSRPGAVTVVCQRGHIWVAFLYRGRLRLHSGGRNPPPRRSELAGFHEREVCLG